MTNAITVINTVLEVKVTGAIERITLRASKMWNPSDKPTETQNEI